MRASPEQPLAKGWDDILDVLAATCDSGPGFRRLVDRLHVVQLSKRLGAIHREVTSQKQPLAKGRPPIHTTTPKKRPLRRALTPPKGTT